MAKSILSEKNNPFNSFISQIESPSGKGDVEVESQGVDLTDRSVRPRKNSGKKTKRLNLLILPELHSKMSKIACMKQTSVNALINEAILEYTSKEIRLLKKYDQTFEKQVIVEKSDGSGGSDGSRGSAGSGGIEGGSFRV